MKHTFYDISYKTLHYVVHSDVSFADTDDAPSTRVLVEMDEEITKFLKYIEEKRLYPKLTVIKTATVKKAKSTPPSRILAPRRVSVPVIAHALAKTPTTRGRSNSHVTPSTTPKSSAGKGKKVRPNGSTPKYSQVDIMSDDDDDDDISTVSRRSMISHTSYMPFPEIQGTSQGMMSAPHRAPPRFSQCTNQIAPQVAPTAPQQSLTSADMMQMFQMFQENMSRNLQQAVQQAIGSQSVQSAHVAPVVMPSPITPIHGPAIPMHVPLLAQVSGELCKSYDY